jgi:long-chain fatty acid transport protein
MRRFPLVLLAGLPSVLGAQGFGLYELGTCTMGRAGAAAASPCPDGSAAFFNPGGLAGLSGTRFSTGVTLVGAYGSFTDDFLAHKTDLDNPLIPVPNAYIAHALTPKLTVALGAYAPYGLETKWPTENFEGRFVGYNTKLRAIYIQPTIGYQASPILKLGIGVAYITSRLDLRQRADLSTQTAAPGITFAMLGMAHGTDFADAALEATGTGVAVNVGGILKVSDRLSIGGHWLTRRKVDYDGTAAFDPVLTGLLLAANNPLGLPAGTPVDALVAGQFGTGGALADGKVTTSITLPPQGTLGFSYQVSDKWTVMGDYQLVVWGWFSSVDIDFQRFANDTAVDVSLHPNNNDTHGFRFGAEYQYSDKVTLRGGYLYHTASSPPEFVTPLLPEGPRNEFTIGAGVTLTPKLRADLGYQYIKQNDRRGLVSTSAGNTGLYKFWGHLFGLGLAYTF